MIYRRDDNTFYAISENDFSDDLVMVIELDTNGTGANFDTIRGDWASICAGASICNELEWRNAVSSLNKRQTGFTKRAFEVTNN